MKVDVTVPNEFQGTVIGNVNQRKGTILDSVSENDDVRVTALLPLSKMFGYSTELSMTQVRENLRWSIPALGCRCRDATRVDDAT